MIITIMVIIIIIIIIIIMAMIIIIVPVWPQTGATRTPPTAPPLPHLVPARISTGGQQCAPDIVPQ